MEKKMLLENLSFKEVEGYLQQKDIILVPVGSVEQHSPYGLIGTDFIVAEALARGVGESMGIMVAPTICYGVSPHHMAFKGTIALTPSTMVAVTADIVRSLTTHGFKRVVFVNGHGGNINSLKDAFQQLKADNVPCCFDVISWYASDRVRKLCNDLFENNEGHHATPGEVSITRYLRSAEFKHKAVHEQKVAKPKYYWPLSAEEMKSVFPDGRMESAPWLATADHGKQILDMAAEELQRKIKEIMALKIL
jgi:creatinine amidohydrolase